MAKNISILATMNDVEIIAIKKNFLTPYKYIKLYNTCFFNRTSIKPG